MDGTPRTLTNPFRTASGLVTLFKATLFLIVVGCASEVPDFEPRHRASVDLGINDAESGIRRLPVYPTIAEEIAGLDCRRSADGSRQGGFFFDVDDAFAAAGSRPDLYLSVHYFDSGGADLEVRYDSTRGDQGQMGTLVSRNAAGPSSHDEVAAERMPGTWQRVSFHLEDAYLGGRLPGGSDFSISAVDGNPFHLDQVHLRSFNHDGAPRVRLMPPPGRSRPDADEYDGAPFRALFENPDGWTQTRRGVDVLGYYDHVLDRFSDTELSTWLPRIGDWGLRFFLETGSIHDWCSPASECIEEQRHLWDRFSRLGARIDGFVMDEPLLRFMDAERGSIDDAIVQTADWIALVRAAYPNAEIGSIEPYPAFSVTTLASWISGLETELAQRGVAGIDFFSLDVDWRRFPDDGDWQEVHLLETLCRERGLPFSLIYWAAPANLSVEDDDWHPNLLIQGEAYERLGGRPDEYDIQSWLSIPEAAIPETRPGTFTHSARDFIDRFVRPGKKGHRTDRLPNEDRATSRDAQSAQPPTSL